MNIKTELAFILSAGEGSRLHPLTDYIPKPLVPVYNKPMIHYTLDALCKKGIKRIVVNLHTHAEKLRKNLELYSQKHSIEIKFAYEKKLLGTGGALYNAREFLKERFFLVNSDFIPDNFSFSDMEKHHTDIATLAVRPMKKGEPYNPVGVDNNGKIVRVEHVWGEDGKDHQFLGVHLIEPEFIEHLKKSNEPFPIFTGLYINIHNAGHSIGSYTSTDVLPFDPGTFKGYIATNNYLRKKINPESNGNIIGENVSIEKNTHIENSIIFSNIKIPSGITIKNSIVGSSPTSDLINKVFIHGKELDFK